jgi:hypothetical protein
MADQKTRVEYERIGTRGDDSITGHGFPSTSDRAEAYTGSDVESAEPRTDRYEVSGKEAVQADRARTIRAEIEQTRGDLSETVNAIQDRLNPSTLAANVVDGVKDAARERVRDVTDTETVRYVRANPVPTAMIGIGVIGLAWLAFGPDQDRARGAWTGRRDWRVRPDEYEAGRETLLSHARAATTARYSTGRTSDDSRVAEQAAQTARRAQNALRRAWNDNPLLIVAAAAVVGGLVAASVPETDGENQLMGETRDSMVDGVQQAVKEKVDEVQNAASSAVRQVQNAVGITSDTGGENPQG